MVKAPPPLPEEFGKMFARYASASGFAGGSIAEYARSYDTRPGVALRLYLLALQEAVEAAEKAGARSFDGEAAHGIHYAGSYIADLRRIYRALPPPPEVDASLLPNANLLRLVLWCDEAHGSKVRIKAAHEELNAYLLEIESVTRRIARVLPAFGIIQALPGLIRTFKHSEKWPGPFKPKPKRSSQAESVPESIATTQDRASHADRTLAQIVPRRAPSHRASVSDVQFHDQLRDFICGHRDAFRSAAVMLKDQYSYERIIARDRRGRMLYRLPVGFVRDVVPEDEPYLALVRFVADAICWDFARMDDGPKADRSHQVLYVAWLLTDPGSASRDVGLTPLESTPYDGHRFVDDVQVADRWWAYEMVYDPDLQFARRWSELVRIAWEIVRTRAAPANSLQSFSSPGSPRPAPSPSEVRTPPDAWPASLGEAGDWMITKNALLFALQLNGAPWTYKLKSTLGRPVWSGPRCSPLFRVNDILKALSAAAPRGTFAEGFLASRPISVRLRRNLRAPAFVPKWQKKATARPC